MGILLIIIPFFIFTWRHFTTINPQTPLLKQYKKQTLLFCNNNKITLRTRTFALRLINLLKPTTHVIFIVACQA